MPLTPGDKIGAYEILGPLGAGGMGEVYRARDAKLNRDVAIKVLPPALAADADYLARFQREAQTLAALNHPNIAAIYGLEGTAIVMELVEGETLKGPLPLKDALPIAKQIAEALEAAHDKGIIHRDLKPGNVKVTPEGVVKVLDFGLAKTAERTTTSTADSPTLTMRATEAGLILGTAGYMSPEQAAGKPVDRRADIWSFGVVLHELITGQRLFDGETVSHTLADVLKTEIDFNKIPAGPIRDLIARCLDRNLKTRLRDIGEARIALENYSPATKPQPAPVTAKASLWPWAVAALALIAGGAGWLRKPAEPPPLSKFEVLPPDGTHLAEVGNSAGSAISPDGRTLVFGAVDAQGVQHLYARALHTLEAKQLPGTEDAGRPFWSPDSKSVGFFAGAKLRRVDLAGGAPLALADAPNGRGGTWNEEGVIVFADSREGLMRIPASGGTPQLLTKLNRDAGESFHYYPHFLPDGKRFLYMIRYRIDRSAKTFLGALDGRPPQLVVDSAYQAQYDAASQRLLYIQGTGTLMARPITFDPPHFTGDPVVVASDVRGSPRNGYAEYSLSRNGILTYGRGESSNESTLAWVDREGKRLGVAASVPRLNDVKLSPDDSRIAVTAGALQDDIWVIDVARGTSSRLTFDNARSPVWSPDGKKIYYKKRDGFYRKLADGSGQEELVLKNGAGMIDSISPDGRYLLFGAGGIYLLPLTPDGKPEAYLDEPKFNESSATVSPDGRWVAYASGESGRNEIYIQGFPKRSGKWLVSRDGGRAPGWRRDGKEIFWVGTDSKMMAATIESMTSTVSVGPPRLLFRTIGPPIWAPAADSKRFLMQARNSEDRPAPPMVLIQAWASQLPK